MKRFFAGLLCLALLCGTAMAEVETITWYDDQTGSTYVDVLDFDNHTGTTTVTDANGKVTVETYTLGDGGDSGSSDSGSSSGSSSSSGTTQNADGSITVVSRDQTGGDYSNIDTSNSTVDSSDGSSSGGLTQEEWEARMAKALAANGTDTETVYRDMNGNIWPVKVIYVGLGRSSVVVNGDLCMVPTSSLSWVSDAPKEQMLAVVMPERQSYVTMRAKKSQKAFVMGHCEKCKVLRVISAGKTWCLVDDGTMRGYVLTAGLAFYANEPRDYATGVITFRGKTTSKNMIHIRSAASNNSKQLEEFSCGTEVTVFSRDEKWTEVDVGGWHGYIMSEYVTMDDSTALLARDEESATP